MLWQKQLFSFCSKQLHWCSGQHFCHLCNSEGARCDHPGPLKTISLGSFWLKMNQPAKHVWSIWKKKTQQHKAFEPASRVQHFWLTPSHKTTHVTHLVWLNQVENKMKPTNPNADTYVEKQRLILLSQFPANPLVEHPDLTHWGDTLVGHPCLTLLRYALVRHSCLTLWFDTLVGHSCLTLF